MKQILMFVFGVPEELPPMMHEARSLAEQGFDVRILGIRRSTKDPCVTTDGGVTISRLYLRSRHLVGDSDRWEVVRYGEAVVRSFVRGFFRNASLIVAHDLVALPHAYPLAKLKRVPIVYRAHELWAEQKADFSRAGFWKALDRFFVPRVDLVVAPEIRRAAIYHHEYHASRDPLVVYNCLPLLPVPTHPTLREVLSTRGVTPEFIFYYQGGISFDRKIDALVEAFTELPDSIALALVGRMEASFAAWFESRMATGDLRRRVVHLGHIPYGPQLFSLCSGAGAGVMFVRGDCRNNLHNVTAANKIFEYMMMGVPILTVDHESHRAFVEGHGIGLCVDAEHPSGIAEGIRHLAGHPDKAREMGARARRLAESEFNWEAQGGRLVEAYRRLLG